GRGGGGGGGLVRGKRGGGWGGERWGWWGGGAGVAETPVPWATTTSRRRASSSRRTRQSTRFTTLSIMTSQCSRTTRPLTPSAVVRMSVMAPSLCRNDTIACPLRPHVRAELLLAGDCRIRVARHIAGVRSGRSRHTENDCCNYEFAFHQLTHLFLRAAMHSDNSNGGRFVPEAGAALG